MSNIKTKSEIKEIIKALISDKNDLAFKKYINYIINSLDDKNNELSIWVVVIFSTCVKNNYIFGLKELFKTNNFKLSQIEHLDSIALRIAVIKNYKNVFKFLLDNMKISNSDLYKALFYACEYNKTSILIFILNETKANPTTNCNESIVTADELGHKEIVKILWNLDSIKLSLINDDEELYLKLKKEYIIKNIEGF